MHKCRDEAERRASCHVEADCIVDQARTDTAGTDHDVFDLLKWRIGERLNDLGVSVDCFHSTTIAAKVAELENENGT